MVIHRQWTHGMDATQQSVRRPYRRGRVRLVRRGVHRVESSSALHLGASRFPRSGLRSSSMPSLALLADPGWLRRLAGVGNLVSGLGLAACQSCELGRDIDPQPSSPDRGLVEANSDQAPARSGDGGPGRCFSRWSRRNDRDRLRMQPRISKSKRNTGAQHAAGGRRANQGRPSFGIPDRGVSHLPGPLAHKPGKHGQVRRCFESAPCRGTPVRLRQRRPPHRGSPRSVAPRRPRRQRPTGGQVDRPS